MFALQPGRAMNCLCDATLRPGMRYCLSCGREVLYGSSATFYMDPKAGHESPEEDLEKQKEKLRREIMESYEEGAIAAAAGGSTGMEDAAIKLRSEGFSERFIERVKRSVHYAGLSRMQSVEKKSRETVKQEMKHRKLWDDFGLGGTRGASSSLPATSS